MGLRSNIFVDNNFYQDYAIAKNKPYMIAETAAAFHTNTPLGPGVGELETKRSWWRQYLTNATFLSTHPQLKLICLFEFMKFEETFADGTPSLRDFRISNKTEIREAFLQDFSSVRQFYLLGDINDTPVPKDNTGATRARSASSMVTVSWAVLATIMVTALSM